jgi:hypothetical protein
MKRGSRQIIVVLFSVISAIAAEQVSAQQVPYGINYQAVARDAAGRELTNTNVDIRFTVLIGTSLGTVAYQEVHNDVPTSRYGVFSATIGKGVPASGLYEDFSQVRWEDDTHFLRVELRFSADFIEMGTMQFLSVPYALYAARSLEPGPAGPVGPAGDPATDNQRLNFDGVNLWIDDGESNPTVISTVNLASLVNDPDDEIQYLSIAGDSLSITRGNSIKLQDINIDDADSDPENEIQDLRVTDNKLRITRNADATEIDLSHLVNDTDLDPGNEIQQLHYNPATFSLSIDEGTAPVDLSGLKNDADASASNELITSMSIQGSNLVITEGGTDKSVNLSSNMIAFRARKNISDSGLNPVADYDFIANNEEYDIGSGYNSSTGEFTAPLDGIYNFNIGYSAYGTGDVRKLYIYLDNALYETLQTSINGGTSLMRSVTMRLLSGQVVKVRFNTGTSTESGTGSFSGFKIF